MLSLKKWVIYLFFLSVQKYWAEKGYWCITDYNVTTKWHEFFFSPLSLLHDSKVTSVIKFANYLKLNITYSCWS